MMPTAREILASMQLALKEHVEPQLEDKWALSALRSVDVLLNHLQARVPVEGAMLHGDTVELADILARARDALAPQPALEGLDDFLARSPAILAGYAPVEELQRLNHQGREAVDTLLRLCRAEKDAGAFGEVHDTLRAYLNRHAERESSFFFPVFVGRPV